MRSVVLCLITALAAACGTTVNGSVDTDPIVGGEPGESGGRTTQAGSRPAELTGGSGTITNGGGAGWDTGAGAGGVTTSAGEGGGPPGAAGEPGGSGGEPNASGGAGGAGGAGGGAGGEPPVVEPWKVCQGGEICGADEVCVYDSATHRICSKIADEFERCDPYAPQSAEFLSGCDGQPIACSQPYRLCNWMSADAAGTRCPTLGRDNQDVRWYCGPPP